MFRNILVHIPSERPVRMVIDVAVGLTLGHRAHLDAIAIGYESMNSIGLIAEGGGAAVAAVMGQERERALERANAAISVFEVKPGLPRSRMAPAFLPQFRRTPSKPSASCRGSMT